MITLTVECRWCCDRKRVQLNAKRSHPCQRCDPQPWQQALVPPPVRFKRPWRGHRHGARAPMDKWR